jgi:ABC-type uncharacterized transport system permease subunit
MQRNKDSITRITVTVIFSLIALFVVYPLIKVIIESVMPNGSFSLSEYKYIFEKEWLR